MRLRDQQLLVLLGILLTISDEAVIVLLVKVLLVLIAYGFFLISSRPHPIATAVSCLPHDPSALNAASMRGGGTFHREFIRVCHFLRYLLRAIKARGFL